MVLKDDFGLEGRSNKPSLLNPPEHDTVKDRVAWHVIQELKERFGENLYHKDAIKLIDAYIEQSTFSGIGEQMARRPHGVYITDDQGAYSHATDVMIFASKNYKEVMGKELTRVEPTSYGF